MGVKGKEEEMTFDDMKGLEEDVKGVVLEEEARGQRASGRGGGGGLEEGSRRAAEGREVDRPRREGRGGGEGQISLFTSSKCLRGVMHNSNGT